MSQSAASQNTVRVNTSDRSGLTAVSDHNQQHPHDRSSTASSIQSSIRSYGSGTGSSPVEQETIQNITEYNNAANPQIECNQQHPFDGYSTASSAIGVVFALTDLLLTVFHGNRKQEMT